MGVTADNSVWKYSEEKGEWFLYSSNLPIDKATTSKLGIVQVGDGIKVQDGKISTNQELIGLDKVENIRQYSENNPAPEIVTFDGVKYAGDTATGVYITSNAVKTVPQALTQEQKKQARENIGAGSTDVRADWNQISPTNPEYIKNKPSIPTKQSDLINDDNTVKDASYNDRVFSSLTEKNNTISQVQTNKTDIVNIKNRLDTNEDDIDKEVTRATGSENKLQQDINRLKGKTQIIGGTNCPVGQEQTVLTTYTKNKTGQADRPKAGDLVNIIY